MKQKIEWYKEMLDLEPGSRIFFPLAKLLAAEGQMDEAALALRQGLSRHPDHVEARLMLVDLLSRRHDARIEMQREIDTVGALFAAYPSFWRVWSEYLASAPSMRGASLAMRFFSTALAGRAFDWGAVMEKGLEALMREAEGGAYPVAGTAENPEDDLGLPVVPRKGIAEELSLAFPEQSVPSAAPAEPRVGALPRARADHADAKGGDAQQDDFGDDDAEETFSLRTRSMAEVLADQGDYATAAEIYRELLQTASAEDKIVLAARLEELSRMGAIPAPVVDKPVENPRDPAMESARLVGLLESLAQRLEERAR